jgi:hypothetical protein
MTDALVRQTDRIRAMTAHEKVCIAQALWIEARDVMASGVRARHPTWTSEQVKAAVRDLMRDAGA